MLAKQNSGARHKAVGEAGEHRAPSARPLAGPSEWKFKCNYENVT